MEISGTQTGELHGKAGTGQRVEFSAADFPRVRALRDMLRDDAIELGNHGAHAPRAKGRLKQPPRVPQLLALALQEPTRTDDRTDAIEYAPHELFRGTGIE